MRAIDPYGISDTFNGQAYRERLLEVSLDTPRIYKHRANADESFRGFSISTDEHGFRGPSHAIPKPAGTKRVLFLGDSVTIGWGVDDDETFVELTEKALSETTGESWECVNSGHMGYDTTQELATFEEVGLLYEPDLVVLVFVDNDVVSTHLVLQQQADPLGNEGMTEEARRVVAMNERLGTFRPYLPYLTALLQYYYVLSSPAGQVGSAEHAKELGFPIEQGWEASFQSILRIQAICAERGMGFCVLDYYSIERLAAFCAEQNVPYDSIAFTEEEMATGVRNSAVDAHANENGHRILTEHVLASLDELGLVDLPD